MPKVEAKATVIVTVPAQSRLPCQTVALPDRDLSQEEATKFWARDRGTIRTCDARRSAAVAAIDAGGAQ